MEQIQNKIDEKFKSIEEEEYSLKDKADCLRLLRKYPYAVAKIEVMSDLLDEIAIIGENISVLHRMNQWNSSKRI